MLARKFRRKKGAESQSCGFLQSEKNGIVPQRVGFAEHSQLIQWELFMRIRLFSNLFIVLVAALVALNVDGSHAACVLKAWASRRFRPHSVW
jgi:hypothetical protein